MQPRLKPRSPSATRWFEGDGGRQAATLAASQAERRPTGDSGIQYVFDRHPLVAAALLDDMQFRKRRRERAPPLLASWNRRLVMLHWLASKLAEAHFRVHLTHHLAQFRAYSGEAHQLP